MIRPEHFDAILDGSTLVIDQNGSHIGHVGQLYLRDETDEPSFVTVRTGLFGNRETFVPLEDATYDGTHVVVPFTPGQVRHAPQVDEGVTIGPDDEAAIYEFYGTQAGGGYDPGPSEERQIGREGGEQLGDVDTGVEAARRQRDHEIAEERYAGTRQRARLRRYEAGPFDDVILE